MHITGATLIFAPKILFSTEINRGTPNPTKYIKIAAVGINSWKKFCSLCPWIVLVKLPQLDTSTMKEV